MRRLRAWPRKSSIIAPDQISRSGWRCPCRRCRAPSRAPARTATGTLRSGLRLADGAMPIVPVQAGPRSDRMSPNRLVATTTSKRCGCSTKRARQDVDVLLVATSRRDSCAAIAATRSSQYGMRDRDAVALGRRRDVLARRVRASSKANFSMRSTPLRVKIDLLHHDLALGAFEHHAADRRVLALGVLAHDRASRCRPALRSGERRRHAGNRRAGRRLTYWSNSRRNLISEPHSETWSGTVAGQPTAPK